MKIAWIFLLLFACKQKDEIQTIKMPGHTTNVSFTLRHILIEEVQRYYSDYNSAVTIASNYTILQLKDTITVSVVTIASDTTNYNQAVNGKTLQSIEHLMMGNNKNATAIDTGFMRLKGVKWAYGWDGINAFELLSYSERFGYLKFEIFGLKTKEENLLLIENMDIKFD